MNTDDSFLGELTSDFKRCIDFHGHLCPGLVYGYRVALEGKRVLDLDRAADEEIVAISENDSCAVDSLQVLLGTTMGKGNLIIRDYGKNAYTVYHRASQKGFRFSRKRYYEYTGPDPDEFDRLEKAYVDGKASEAERRRQKRLKAFDLLNKPFEAIFHTDRTAIPEPPLAPLAPSEPCAECGEMTMATKMSRTDDGRLGCRACCENCRVS